MLSVSIHYFVENIRVEVGRLCCTRLKIYNIYIYAHTGMYTNTISDSKFANNDKSTCRTECWFRSNLN